jgi:hypothetical protein
MDPIGLALENFDGTGQWRTTDSGFPIDPSSQMVDGTPLDGPSSLRKALLSRPEAVVGTMTQKLLMYGIGRETKYPDMPVVRAIMRAAEPNRYKFSDLVLGVVRSAPFQMRVKKIHRALWRPQGDPNNKLHFKKTSFATDVLVRRWSHCGAAVARRDATGADAYS